MCLSLRESQEISSQDTGSQEATWDGTKAINADFSMRLAVPVGMLGSREAAGVGLRWPA